MVEPDFGKDDVEATSEISSLAESIEEQDDQLQTSPLSPRKRKLSDVGHDTPVSQKYSAEPPAKSTKLFRTSSARPLTEISSHGGVFGELDGEAAVESPDDVAMIHEGSPDLVTTEQEECREDKQLSRTISIDKDEPDGQGVREDEAIARHAEEHETSSSNEDDGDHDDIGDAPEDDGTVKVEESCEYNQRSFRSWSSATDFIVILAQKKVALNALNAMEKCFATLRDKYGYDFFHSTND